MNDRAGKQLSNPFSTGGGGSRFESHVQACFVALMLTGGYAPCLPSRSINKIKLQGKFAGYQTDDLIVFVKDQSSNSECKLLGQIKHTISITESDSTFTEVIKAAWIDFNNGELFNRDKDVIALITGPLSATDTNDARTILEWARHSESSEEFFQKVELVNFSSISKRTKLKVFKEKLKVANANNEVPDDEVYSFLKHFHLLGYDLDIRTGVMLSLLHSLIGQFSTDNVQSIWAGIVDVVQSTNQNAGTITKTDIPKDLLKYFQQRSVSTIPNEFAVPITPVHPSISGNQHQLAAMTLATLNQHQLAAMTLATLIGSWDERNESDMEVFRRLANDFESVESVDTTLREMIQNKESSIKLENGHRWVVVDREINLKFLSKRIFDKHLDLIKQISIEVLSEIDPQFELLPAERWFAILDGKKLRYSKNLREGLAELIVWLGINGDTLENCSDKKRDIALLITREILSKASWQLWGSLNDLLPTLAEAAPDEFLKAVEHSLGQTPCPFDELFAQEETGIGGRNYMTGLLWALESLAWIEKYLSLTCVVLAELASHDPGGNWANRPANSITTILLPWHPQTLASIEKRVASIEAIRLEFPNIAWKILLTLLPNSHQTSMGTHKPRWRNVEPDDRKPTVTHEEYVTQIKNYASLAVEMACDDIARLTVLVSRLDNLPQPLFDTILGFLSANKIARLPEIERMPIWTSLSDFVRKNRRYAGSRWALDEQLVAKIETVAEKLSPKSAEVLHRRLFITREIDLYEEKGNWEEQRKKLESKREQAIREVLKNSGIDGVISFIDNVEVPHQVGWALGKITDAEITTHLLPRYLNSENEVYQQFISGYIRSCYQRFGLTWVDELNQDSWSVGQRCQLLMSLPFEKEVWSRASAWLGDSENMYWKEIQVNPYQTEGDLLHAIDKLLEVERPQVAIYCLYARIHKQLPLDSDRTIKALLSASSTDESTKNIDSYHITDLIKALQNDPTTDQDGLFRVEWAYLPLLNDHQECSPALLEGKLANDPEFFCEIVRLIFRSKHEEKKDEKPNEQADSIALNAWRLLKQWKRTPGVQKDGTFSSAHFESWLSSVKNQCIESGHLEVALSKIGEVLYYSPADPKGLWIIEVVAKALNGSDAEEMRNGYSIRVFNSRGVYWVDPTGEPERKLAELWHQRADSVENAGFARFAASLRDLAKSYDRDADRIIADHKLG